MIIYDGEKYACVSCIRGHRSSTCRHANRMLVKVRNRGRHGSLDIRKVIIVDTESQIRPDENSPACDSCSESNASADAKECEKMNRQPILFLKTVRTQRAVLSDGKLKIIVEEKDGSKCQNGTKTQDGYKFVSEKEFLRQHCISLGNHGFINSCSCQEKAFKRNKFSKSVPIIVSESDDSRAATEPEQIPVFKTESQNLNIECTEAPLLSGDQKFGLNAKNNKSNTNGICGAKEVGIMVNNAATSGKVYNNGASHNDISSIQAMLNQKPMVELLTHKGLYLSTQCSCADDSCLCGNCLLHRNEDELNSYIEQSGVPLTNLGEARLANSEGEAHCGSNCKCKPDECLCDDCLEHPTEIISFNRFLFHGILNVHLKRKTIINFKGRLIPSQYWWDFLKFQVPLMSDIQLDSLDIIVWFESIISTYSSQLVDVNAFNAETTQAMFGL